MVPPILIALSLLVACFLLQRIYRRYVYLPSRLAAKIRVGRYYDLTTEEIAERLKITSEDIHQIEAAPPGWFESLVEKYYLEHLELNSKCGLISDPWFIHD